MEKKCVNCKWYTENQTCANEDGDKLCQYVDRMDDCEKWEFIGDE